MFFLYYCTMNFRLSALALICTLFFLSDNTFAKTKKERVPPAALFIQLNTEQVRANHLRTKGDTNSLAKLQAASGRAAQVMINDFTDHFKFCPVYYFYDSNLTRLQQGDYSVLMDANRKQINEEKKAKITTISSNYFIGYFGFTGIQINKNPKGVSDDPSDPETLRHDKVYGTSYGHAKSTALNVGFVVTTMDAREIQRFFVGRNRDMNMFVGSFRSRDYNYSSSDFTIDYVRSAKTLNSLFFDYYQTKK